MKKKIGVGLVGILAIMGVWYVYDSVRSYDSLQEAVQSEWKTPIEVVNQEEKLEVVYYLDGNRHIVDVYQHEVGKYRYNNRQSTGLSFSSETGLPFYVQAHHFKGAGNVVYGAIKSDQHEVNEFIIEYKNGKQQKITAKNNTFIATYPDHLNPDILMFQEDIENITAYDLKGNVVERYY